MTTQLIIVIILVIFILLAVMVFFVYRFAKSDMQLEIEENNKKAFDKNIEKFNEVKKRQDAVKDKYAQIRNNLNNTDTH